MINIRTYTSAKRDNSSSSGSTGEGSTVINNVGGQADKWFIFDSDNNAVCCKFDFYSVGAVSANRTSALTESLGLTPSQIAALQQLLSDPDTATKLQAIADKTTLTNTGTATAVSIDAQVAQQANP